MENNKREMTIYTPYKVYRGMIDVPNDSLRTIDLFNSSNIYWRDPAQKGFDNALMLHDATVLLEGNTRLGEFSSLQINLPDVIFFHDSLENLSNEMEKKRAAFMKQKTRDEVSLVQIFTHSTGDSFFFITGTFYGLFKSKSKNRYIPITKVKVVKVIRIGEKWQKQKIPIEGGFVGVSTSHIEACSFSDKQNAD